MALRNYHSFSTAARRRAMPHGVDSMFAWTIFIFLLIGFTLFCWMGSFYIFGHPEKAANYHLLKRLHKLEDPQRFQITAAPRGEFLKPQQLLERFGSLTPVDIHLLNEKLLRNFIRNYHQTRELVPYATGTYKVLAVQPLTKKNIFYPGVVTLLQSLDQPEIFLEQVFTSSAEQQESLQSSLTLGLEIKLEKPLDLSAIIFVERLHDGHLKLTTMPLLYGTYGPKQGTAIFSLEPPNTINIEAGLPIFTSKEVETATQHATPCSKKTAVLNSEKPTLKDGTLTGTSSTQLARIVTNEQAPVPKNNTARAVAKKPAQSPPPPSTKEFQPTTIARAVPVNTPAILPAIAVSNTPSPKAMPVAVAMPIAAAVPVASAVPVAAAVPIKSTTVPVAAAIPVAAAVPIKSTANPAATPIPTATPLGTPAATATPMDFSPLTTAPSFSTSPIATNSSMMPPASTPAQNGPSATWPLYEPGKIPRGRLVDPAEFSNVAAQGLNGERLYVQGDFAVTASGDHRAVLRYQSASTDLPIGRTGKIRIIVLYPDGTIPPAEGTSITHGRQHPLMITDVKKEKDGTIDLFTRDITK